MSVQGENCPVPLDALQRHDRQYILRFAPRTDPEERAGVVPALSLTFPTPTLAPAEGFRAAAAPSSPQLLSTVYAPAVLSTVYAPAVRRGARRNSLVRGVRRCASFASGVRARLARAEGARHEAVVEAMATRGVRAPVEVRVSRSSRREVA
jgi:hypothetical protein